MEVRPCSVLTCSMSAETATTQNAIPSACSLHALPRGKRRQAQQENGRDDEHHKHQQDSGQKIESTGQVFCNEKRNRASPDSGQHPTQSPPARVEGESGVEAPRPLSLSEAAEWSSEALATRDGRKSNSSPVEGEAVADRALPPPPPVPGERRSSPQPGRMICGREVRRGGRWWRRGQDEEELLESNEGSGEAREAEGCWWRMSRRVGGGGGEDTGERWFRDGGGGDNPPSATGRSPPLPRPLRREDPFCFSFFPSPGPRSLSFRGSSSSSSSASVPKEDIIREGRTGSLQPIA